MKSEKNQNDLIQHLCRMSTLSPDQAARLVDEVIHFFDTTPEQFIVARHSELQQSGYSNAKIYSIIESEMTQRVFKPPTMTQRQIRRVIYG